MRRLALLAVLLFSVLPVMAAEKDADYYQRTGTQPPLTGDFLLGPSLHYADQLGLGVAFGYTWHKAGVTLLGDFSALRIDAITGTTSFSYRCRDFEVPYSTESHTKGQAAVTVLFRLKKP